MAHLKEAHDVTDIVFETQIDHPVSFVHAEVLAVVERESLLLEHVYETPWSRHYDVEALVQDMTLLPHRNAADTQQCVELRILPVLCKRRSPSQDVLVRLRGQFPRRTEDDADRAFATDERQSRFLLKSDHNERKTESERLSRTGERDANHVPSGEPIDNVSSAHTLCMQ